MNWATAWLTRYLTDARPHLLIAEDPGVVFLATNGERLGATWLTGQVHHYIDAADIGKVGSCHLFRHTAATLMLEGGADTGEACRQNRHESCPAWWGKGHAGTRCDCPCHLPEASSAPETTTAYEGDDVLLFVSFYCKASYHHNCPRWRQPSNRCACPCHHPDQRPD